MVIILDTKEIKWDRKIIKANAILNRRKKKTNMIEMLYQIQTIKSLKTKTIFTDLLNPECTNKLDKRSSRTFHKPNFGLNFGVYNQLSGSHNQDRQVCHFS